MRRGAMGGDVLQTLTEVPLPLSRGRLGWGCGLEAATPQVLAAEKLHVFQTLTPIPAFPLAGGRGGGLQAILLLLITALAHSSMAVKTRSAMEKFCETRTSMLKPQPGKSAPKTAT